LSFASLRLIYQKLVKLTEPASQMTWPRFVSIDLEAEVWALSYNSPKAMCAIQGKIQSLVKDFEILRAF